MRKNISDTRLNIPGAIYFVTTVTKDRFPYFNEDENCMILSNDIKFCQTIKNFHLYGYKINPDHIHLLIQTSSFEESISSILHNIKRTSSLHISKGGIWQKSFHDRVVRNESELNAYIQYLKIQWIKHKLPENKWLFIEEDIYFKEDIEENFVGEDIYPHPQSFPLLEKSHPLQKFYHSSNLYLSTNPKNNFIEKENL